MDRLRVLIHSFALLFLSVVPVLAQLYDTVRVATVNLSGYSAEEGDHRIRDYRSILDKLDADVVAVQGLVSLEAMLDFARKVSFQVLPQLTPTGNFQDSQDSYSVVLLTQPKFVITGRARIDGLNKDIILVSLLNTDTDDTITIVTLDWVSGDDPISQGLRNQDAILLDSVMMEMGLYERNLVVAGTFNARMSEAPELQKIMVDGKLIDPADRPGEWYNNVLFADLHTASTRVGEGDDLGLIDRSDLILLSGSLNQRYIDGSYTVFGNDGQHFADSVNGGINNSVSSDIAQSLHDASDHLPVYLDLVFERGLVSVKGFQDFSRLRLDIK